MRQNYPAPQPREQRDEYRDRLIDWLVDLGFEPSHVLLQHLENHVDRRFPAKAVHS